MKIEKIRAIAKKMHVESKGLNKTLLIRAIQKSEGNTECFGTGKTNKCPQKDCLWMEDCLVTG